MATYFKDSWDRRYGHNQMNEEMEDTNEDVVEELDGSCMVENELKDRDDGGTLRHT